MLACLSLPGSAAAADATPTCAEGPSELGGTVYGTPCSDTIVAPASVEDVKGGGGDDTILAAPLAASAPCPDSCQFLGVGSQTFEGGPGDDVVFGERGNDTLLGGPGNDRLYGGIGDDLLLGGPGDDLLAGGFGADSIDGEEGSDYVRGDSTIDRIYDTGPATDDDTLSYSTGITPSFGNEYSAQYSAYPDFPAPGGERGVRLFLGKTGLNANNGVAPDGGGVDEVEVGAFETIVGTPFSDHIEGTVAREMIYGGGGGDVLKGGGGSDALDGGADGDVCEGGTPSPTCETAISTRNTTKVSVGFMTPPEATPYAELYLVGSSGNDGITASYSSGAVTFQLSAGTFDEEPSDKGGCEIESPTEAVCSFTSPVERPLDSLLLAGMDGNDTIAASNFPATVSVVEIGGEGSDSLTGGEESEDILVDGPGSGADVLNALGRDDALTHNGGADELQGGNGNDLFLSSSVCDGERIVGGPDRDNASWARFGEGIEANLQSGTAGRPGGGEAPDCGGEPPDSIAEVEDLEGSSYDDVLYGDAGPNQLLGHQGADVYVAGAGEDSILANSADADKAIDCGPDNDSATIDRPQYNDPTPVGCESVYEADPNNFRTRTLLPPPPLPEPTPVPAPVKKPPRDRHPPQTRVLHRPHRVVGSHRKWRAVSFRFASNEAGSRFRCKLDAKPYRPCVSPRRYRVKLGRHAFRVFAIDRAGNRDRTPVVFRFRLRLR
ncbi:MAG TPA: calcium-binding protein [Solirubrobacterales bacterium]|nr:calcium-binding protein [Solirubrobacterales bacterium]